MNWCECCGCRSYLLRQEQRGAFCVDVYQCPKCGEWEDYRVPPQPTITLDILAARHDAHRAKERIRARQRYQQRARKRRRVTAQQAEKDRIRARNRYYSRKALYFQQKMKASK